MLPKIENPYELKDTFLSQGSLVYKSFLLSDQNLIFVSKIEVSPNIGSLISYFSRFIFEASLAYLTLPKDDKSSSADLFSPIYHHPSIPLPPFQDGILFVLLSAVPFYRWYVALSSKFVCSFVCQVSVSHYFLSTILWLRPYKPYIFWKLMPSISHWITRTRTIENCYKN